MMFVLCLLIDPPMVTLVYPLTGKALSRILSVRGIKVQVETPYP